MTETVVQEDVVYRRDGERELHVDVFHPPEGGALQTAVIQIHGGRWRAGTRKTLRAHGERMSALGFTCLAIEYRSVVEAPWPTNLQDVKAAIRWVRAGADELGIDADRIALQGFSSGGHLALVAAGTPTDRSFEAPDSGEVSAAVSAVAVAYPSTTFRLAAAGDGDRLHPDIDAEGNIPSWLLLGDDATAEDVHAANVPTHISPAFPPTLIAHGTGDTVIPHASTLRLFASLEAAGVDCDLHLYGRADHVFDAGPSFGDVFDREVALFLRRTVAEPDVISGETPSFSEILAQTAGSDAMTAPVASR